MSFNFRTKSDEVDFELQQYRSRAMEGYENLLKLPCTEEGSFKFIISAIEDPYKLKKCTRSLTAALFTIVPHHAVPRPWDEKENEKKGLYQALYRFIAADRTNAQVDAMVKGRARCPDCSKTATRSPESTYFHGMGQLHSGLYSMMHDKNREMEQFITMAMDVTTQYLSNECDFLSIAQGTAPRWPHNISELLIIPSGPTRLAESLFSIYEICPDSYLLRIVARVTSLCRTRVYEALTEPPFMELAGKRMKKDLDEVIRRIDGHQITSCIQADKAVSVLTMASRPFFDIVKCAIEPHVLPGVTAGIMDGYQVQALQIFSIILYIIPYLRNLIPSGETKELDALEKETLTLGGCLVISTSLTGRHVIHTMSWPPVTLHPYLVEFDNACHFGTPEGLMADIGLATFLSNPLESACGAAGCYNRIETVGGANFKKCSRCQMVFYCSTACQHKSWKAKEKSHKQQCPVLRKVYDVVHPSFGEPDLFDSLKSFSHVPGPTLDKVEVAQRIVDRAELTKEEMGLLHEWAVGVGYFTPMVMMKATRRTPFGYDDYKALITRFTDPSDPRFSGPPAKYVTPLANLPFKDEAKRRKREIFENSIAKRAGIVIPPSPTWYEKVVLPP